MQVIFFSEIKLQKHIFWQKIIIFLAAYLSYLNPLLGWKCAYICHNVQNQKQGI